MIVKKAGCILINYNTKKIALVCRNNEYSFPKGHLEKGETIQECAIRETIEETGHNCHTVCNEAIAQIHYTSSKGENVENYFYLAIDDGVSKRKIKEKDKEETIWKDFNEIEETLSYSNLKELWNTIKNRVNKEMQKKCNIFLSKKENYLESAYKIKKEANFPVDIIWIEDFIESKDKVEKLNDSIIYFLCNSSLTKELAGSLKNIKCYICNREFFEKNYDKKEMQNILTYNKIETPKMFLDLTYNNIKLPVFCKENRHAGIIFKAYTHDTLNRFFEKFSRENFYIEESIDGDLEEKVYYIKGKKYYKNNEGVSSIIDEYCEKISKVLHLDIFSIDFIKRKGKYVIIDVNPSAGFFMHDDARNYLISEFEKLEM